VFNAAPSEYRTENSVSPNGKNSEPRESGEINHFLILVLIMAVLLVDLNQDVLRLIASRLDAASQVSLSFVNRRFCFFLRNVTFSAPAFTRDLFDLCLGHSSINFLEWFLEFVPLVNRKIFKRFGRHSIVACSTSSLKVLQWLHSNGFTFHPYCLKGLGNKGGKEEINWLLSSKVVQLTPSALEGAIHHGDLEFIQWLVQTLHCPFSKEAIDAAIDSSP
jgi:hypothetical protein